MMMDQGSSLWSDLNIEPATTAPESSATLSEMALIKDLKYPAHSKSPMIF